MSPDRAKQIRETVKWFDLSEELFPKNGLVLAAVSGGPDSMAMVSILDALAAELGFKLAIAHFDHGIRDTSDNDRQLVADYANDRGLSFYTRKGDVAADAETSGDSLEEAARRARYGFLDDLADRIKADRIATGHTRDDQAETILMRILHGTGIRGLTGIPVRRGRVVRPLLTITRQDTVAYCDELGIDYVLDATNKDRRHMRNRIRNELLPLLEGSYHNGAAANLVRLGQNAGSVVDHIRAQTRPLIRQNLREVSRGEWVLNISKMSTLDETSIFVLFGDIFADSLGCDTDFARVHYEKLAQLVKDSRGSGKKLSLPGLRIKREYENLLISKATASASVADSWECHATLTFPGETRVAGLVVKTEIVDKKQVDDAAVMATDSVAYFALSGLKLPLVLKNPGPGDRMRPFGMNGEKKLSDIFTDKKIPGRKRAASLVVADADNILWLVGVTTNEKTRVDGDTDKIVRISVREGR